MKFRVKSRIRFLTFLVIAIIMTVSAFNLLIGTTAKVEAESRQDYKTIEICAGDSLWTIADEYMPNDMDRREAVYELRKINDLSATDTISAGDKLVVPDIK